MYCTPRFESLTFAYQGEPVIYASFNYRVNSFGFLASQELLAASKNGTGALNAGLYDIQAALLWIQQNIDSFGGDHNKVRYPVSCVLAFLCVSLRTSLH